MVESKLQPFIDKYINDPSNPDTNYWLAYEYEKIGQNAAALSYYLRCAEISEDKDLVYECLLKTWLMLHRTKRRPWYEHKQLLTAITYYPKRPEAYYLLSILHEKKEEWKECFYYASVGLELCDFDLPDLRTGVEYPGDFALLLQKAFSSWYVGQREYSKKLWLETYNHPNISPKFKELAKDNLAKFNLLNYDNNEKVDIILQGKYSEYSLETAKQYLKLPFVDNIIISCWVDDNIPTDNFSNIKFIKNKYPSSNGTGNRNLQLVSSLNGVKNSTSTFVVKMRNDQRYDNESMQKMYNFFNENKQKKISYENDNSFPKNRILVAGNFYAFPFHPRDHVFWGNREDLIELFDIPLEQSSIEERVKMKREDYWKYYDCYIRTESYIGSHYCSNFDERIKKWLLKPELYLYDDSSNYNEALELSNKLTKKIFKSFPKEGINLEWDKYNWKKYPYDNQYTQFHERWHEDGY